MVVPRIYADSLVSSNDPHSLSYLKDLTAKLIKDCPIFYCGDDIVAKNVGTDSLGYIEHNRLIIWDNFYANDYCPRRLFIGPWRRPRDTRNLLLNLTGMIETDKLLLQLIQFGDDFDAWHNFLGYYLPESFFTLAVYFDAPLGFTKRFNTPSLQQAIDAVDNLLWHWKSPLQREWFAILMGLKQDLLIFSGEMSAERVLTTQSHPLASALLELPND